MINGKDKYTKIREDIAGYKCLILHLLQQIDDKELTDEELEIAGVLLRSSDVQALLDDSVKEKLRIILEA